MVFEAATDREEYYKLLAQKIYHIRKELEERKNRKKAETKGIGFVASLAVVVELLLTMWQRQQSPGFDPLQKKTSPGSLRSCKHFILS